MTPEHQATGGFAVEAVGEGRVAGQSETQGFEIVLEARAALRAAMDRHARRFVEHEHQSIAIEQPRSCFFGRHEDIGSQAVPPG